MYETPNYRKEDIMRKLQEKGQVFHANNSRVEPVTPNQGINALVGAPFFQYERDLSVSDKVHKPYFRGSSSDVEAHDKNKVKRKESLDSFESKHEYKGHETNNSFLWKVHIRLLRFTEHKKKNSSHTFATKTRKTIHH
jgi:hypothetical protein